MGSPTTYLEIVKGLRHEGREQNTDGITVGETVHLMRQPDNPHDPNAVKVMRYINGSFVHIGFLDRGFVSRHDLIAAAIAASVDEVKVDSDGNVRNVKVRIDADRLRPRVLSAA